MCGFVGIRRLDGRPVDVGQLDELGRLLAHRGPDGSGLWAEGPVGLAHRRLAVIDVGGSPQPMASADGRLQLAFNGEVLNYRQLRRRHPHPYRTDGDTEVVVALHQRLGPAAVQELRGQFAYAVHDRSTSETWLVRDRLGILPLYVVVTPELVAFASEPKALLPLLARVEVDEVGLDAYLSARAVPAPRTLVKGVEKLPPAHVAHIDGHGVVRVSRYWSPPQASVGEVSDDEAIARVGGALLRSMTDNLVADVPVGSYLSGGLDSSLVAALAAERRAPGVLHTFSAGFGDARIDETPFARLVADALGTTHHEVQVDARTFADDWRRLTWHRDAPLSEPADVAVHHLARAASEHVKVVLSGEGADELFAGYPKHRLARLTELAVPRSARVGCDALQQVLPSGMRRSRIALRSMTADSAPERAASWFSPFTGRERRALLGRPSSAPVAATTSGEVHDGTALGRMLRRDCGSWLADNLLERGDRMSMAASVELRPPFLDHRLVELAFSLPDRVKLRHGQGKWVLRQLAAPRLPAVVVERPKAGFRVPLDAWFRGDLRDMAWDRLTSPGSFAREVFDGTEVRRLLERHDRGRSDEAIRIWTLVGLELWHEVTFGAAPRPVPVGVPS
jgi:asparagine synthase (glutamine-hydrolysing)